MLALDAAIAGDHDQFQDLVMSHDYRDCGIVQLQMKAAIW
jgi:hypothetical protein